MADAPWAGDACSLVDAFRARDRSPVEELEATYAAIDASDLNAFSFLDPDRASAAAAEADVSLPFGGVPTGIKELEPVEGWPHTEASLGAWDFRPGLARVAAPTLIVHGELDAIPMDLVEEWTAALPGAKLVKVPGASHFPYVERPEIVWPEIERFLQATPP